MAESFYIYHGTKSEYANNILKKQKYYMSHNNDDWLGTGIYFYTRLEDAILYNIRKYKNEYKKYPEYENLIKNRKILVSKISYNKDEEIDLNDFENLSKFLMLWKTFIERIKKCEKYSKTRIKDGVVIDWLMHETNYFNGCKVIKNIFTLDLRFKRNILEIFNEKTRIGYQINQQYICVVDDSCIKQIKEYNIIRNFTNKILMKG